MDNQCKHCGGWIMSSWDDKQCINCGRTIAKPPTLHLITVHLTGGTAYDLAPERPSHQVRLKRYQESCPGSIYKGYKQEGKTRCKACKKQFPNKDKAVGNHRPIGSLGKQITDAVLFLDVIEKRKRNSKSYFEKPS